MIITPYKVPGIRNPVSAAKVKVVGAEYNTHAGNLRVYLLLWPDADSAEKLPAVVEDVYGEVLNHETGLTETRLLEQIELQPVRYAEEPARQALEIAPGAPGFAEAMSTLAGEADERLRRRALYLLLMAQPEFAEGRSDE